MKKPVQRVQGKRVYSGIRRKKKSEFYFDDCYVCRAMKKSEERGKDLGIEELKEVFQKANEQN